VVQQSTWVAVVASQVVGHKNAAGFRRAGIVGARVVVIALDEVAQALSFYARIPFGAHALVVARLPLIHRSHRTFSSFRIAQVLAAGRVFGRVALHYTCGIDYAHAGKRLEVAHQHAVAQVLVVVFVTISVGFALAQVFCAGDARSLAALVTFRALVAVIAKSLVGNVLALTGFLVAAVISARVVVVAGDLVCPRDTFTLLAGIPEGAHVAVVATAGHRRGNTSDCHIARVRSAHFAIVAGQRFANAEPGHARVPGGAHVAVVATALDIGIEAFTGLRVTGVQGTFIFIVARLLGPRRARTFATLVTFGTRVAVVARGCGRHVLAARLGQAAIRGAHLAVIAIQGDRAHAVAVSASVGGGTEAAVIAG